MMRLSSRLSRCLGLFLTTAVILTLLPGCVTSGPDELTVLEDRMNPRLAKIREKDATEREREAMERAYLASLEISLPEPDFQTPPEAIPAEVKFTPRGGVTRRTP